MRFPSTPSVPYRYVAVTRLQPPCKRRSHIYARGDNNNFRASCPCWLHKHCCSKPRSRTPQPDLKNACLSSQSPEIAQMRSENEPRQRVSGRAQRLSAALTGTGVQEERPRSVSSPIHRNPSISPEHATTRGRAQSRTDYVAGGAARLATADKDQQQTDASKRGRTGRRSLGRRQGEAAADDTGEDAQPSYPSSFSRGTGAAAGGGQPMITACESDIWAWALMVLQMFSDDVWPPGSGQVCVDVSALTNIVARPYVWIAEQQDRTAGNCCTTSASDRLSLKPARSWHEQCDTSLAFHHCTFRNSNLAGRRK